MAERPVYIHPSISPYDPDQIKIESRNENLGTLLEMLASGKINPVSDISKKTNQWNNDKRSRFIESVLLGLPLPPFYFREDSETDNWLVVDGLQRLIALKSFYVDKTLKLSGLEFLEACNGKGYDDLSRAEHRTISSFKVSCHIIDKNTPPVVRKELQKRFGE